MFDTRVSNSLYSNAIALPWPLPHHRHQHFASRTASRRPHGPGTALAAVLAGSLRRGASQGIAQASGDEVTALRQSSGNPVRGSVGRPRYCWTFHLDRSHCGCGRQGCCVSGDCAGWCAVAGDCGGLFAPGRDADRDEQFPAGSGCSGDGRSGRLADLSSRHRAVRCCPADVSRRQCDRGR